MFRSRVRFLVIIIPVAVSVSLDSDKMIKKHYQYFFKISLIKVWYSLDTGIKHKSPLLLMLYNLPGKYFPYFLMILNSCICEKKIFLFKWILI